MLRAKIDAQMTAEQRLATELMNENIFVKLTAHPECQYLVEIRCKSLSYSRIETQIDSA